MPSPLVSPLASERSVPEVSLPEMSFLQAPLCQASQTQFSGNLCLTWEGAASWGLTFRHGRLVWAWAANHRLRRWRRLLGPHCNKTLARSPAQGFASTQPVWEYETLTAMVAEELIEPPVAWQIIRQNLTEVIFDLVQKFYTTRVPPQFQCQPFKLAQPLKFFAPSEILDTVHLDWNNWCQAQLQNHSPMLAPVICQPAPLQAAMSAASYGNLQRLLQGQWSLRELATLTNQALLPLSQTLVGYEQRGLIRFAALPNPLGEAEPKPPAPPCQPVVPDTPLVLCIDDSELICQQLGKIITAAGYRYVAVQNSLEGLQRVLELKPSLIFLDLVMPVVSGYELCAQIRRISGQRDVPIVILTSNDGVLDRVRLKVSGSTDFLSKPIAEAAILKVLANHCLAKTA